MRLLHVLVLLLSLLLSGCQEVGAFLVGVRLLDPAALQAELDASPAPLVVDLRDPDAWEAASIPGSQRVPLSDLDGWLVRSGLSRETPLVFVCDLGHLSMVGAATAGTWGFGNARSLEGGMEAWSGSGGATAPGAAASGSPVPGELPRREVSTFTAVLLVAVSFGVKPLYMALSLALALALARVKERDLWLLRQALVAFFVGESLCALNYLAAGLQNDPMEVGHLLGMMAFGALLPWALFDLVDRRILRLTDPVVPCVGIRLCGACWKRQDASGRPVGCGLHRLMQWALPALALLALIPFCLALEPGHMVVPVLGTDVVYGSTLFLQVVEFRAFPLLALACFLVAWALLLRGRRGLELSKPFFFLGQGALTFVLLRFFFRFAWRPSPPWADIWEEVTELVAILGVGILLLTFRRQLDVLPFLEKGPRGTR